MERKHAQQLTAILWSPVMQPRLLWFPDETLTTHMISAKPVNGFPFGNSFGFRCEVTAAAARASSSRVNLETLWQQAESVSSVSCHRGVRRCLVDLLEAELNLDMQTRGGVALGIQAQPRCAPLLTPESRFTRLDSLSGWQNVARHPYALDKSLLPEMQVSAGPLASSDGQLCVFCLPLEERFSIGETAHTLKSLTLSRECAAQWVAVCFPRPVAILNQSNRFAFSRLSCKQVTEAASGTVVVFGSADEVARGEAECVQSPWGAVARLLHQLSAVKSLLFRCRNASSHIKRDDWKVHSW